MQRLTAPLSLGLLALAGCGPSYPPLVCDPGRAGELAFGYQAAGALFWFGADNANGSELLFIDGSCRYWTRSPSAPYSTELVQGVLDAATLDAMNRDLLTWSWAVVDGERRAMSTDADTVAIARDSILAIDGGSPELDPFLDRARHWAGLLAALGTPATGPVRLELEELPDSRTTAIPWTGRLSLAALAESPYPVRTAVRVDDADDAALLREARAALGGRHGFLREGELYFLFRVVDVVPFADAAGCLRPLFPGACMVLFNNDW